MIIQKKILFICGPTATGKTALALKLAKKFNAELVSADSRQVYRGMDIGTGKDLPAQCLLSDFQILTKYKNKAYRLKAYLIDDIPLWLYDIVDPDEEFSVAHYQTLAGYVIKDIWQRKRLPIVVGGTGLYIRSLITPLETINIPPNQKLRKELTKQSLVQLQTQLRSLKPGMWDQLNESDRQNPRRLIRKIEIANCLKGAILTQGRILKDLDSLIIGLTASLPQLYQRIDQRVDLRVKQGIIQEIQQLLDQGYGWDLSAMNALGYREWQAYFESSKDRKNLREAAIQHWKFDEHGLARRQLTWFRKQKNIRWFNIMDSDYLKQVVKLVDKWYTGG